MPNHQLAFDRDLIAQGEGWRIITGNLAHTNGWHLLLNLSGLAVLYSLFQEYLTGWRLPVLLLLLGTAVGLGIWWGCPQTQWYMGLSGLLHFGRGLALPMGSSGVDGLGVQTNGEEAEQQAGECADEV